MKGVIGKLLLLIGMIMLAVSSVSATTSNPGGPSNLDRISDSKFDTANWESIMVEAEAGNVTELNITGISPTQTWQGYYGEVTGTITLDDANNNTMYDWGLAEPQGEIYASNGSIVTWANIQCLNYSGDGAAEINLSIVEGMFGLASDDVDGVNETFDVSGLLSDDATQHPIVYVGTYTIGAGTCPATDTYESDAQGSTDFIEVLLTDTDSIIFTSIIENDVVGNDTEITGFDSLTHDFQLLVGEDGHDGDDTTTPYYFFVELE